MKIATELLELINRDIDKGYIRVAKHPEKPLKIYNYTQSAQFEEYWDEATRICRGLVLDDKHNIIIKCPEKFFNFDHPLAASVDMSNARISEKLDGYYISIQINNDYGLIVTSRGSFENKYTKAAETFLTDDIILKMPLNYTYFCELLQDFPGDEAIILTKHSNPQLVCWAIKDENFNEVFPDEECPFPYAQTLSLAEAKEYLRKKVEGIVAQDTKTFERVKHKTEYFLEHHRLLSNCTKKQVWELLSQGKTVADLDLPDEFMKSMLEWQDELQYDFSLISQAVENEFRKRIAFTDKDIALDSKLSPEMKSFIFTYKKKGNQALTEQIWKALKP